MIFATHKPYTYCVERDPLDPNHVGFMGGKNRLDIFFCDSDSQIENPCHLFAWRAAIVVAFDERSTAGHNQTGGAVRRRQCGTIEFG